MLSILILIVTILIGTITPIQAGLNSYLGKYLDNTLHAAFISFLGGFLLICLFSLLTGKFFPTLSSISKVPSYLLTGGFLGAVFIVVSIPIAHKLGATLYISCIVAGQLLASLVLDHFGLLGFTVHPFNLTRMLGIIFLFLGVILIKIF